MRVNWDEAAPGLSNALRSLAANYGGRGYDDQLRLESQLAQRLASIEGARANAALDAARKQKVEQEIAAAGQRPDLARRFGANVAGMSPTAYTGNVGNMEAGRPIVVDDPTAQMSRFAQPAEQRRFQSALAQQLALEGDPNWNPDQIAKARGQFQEQDVLAGLRDASTPIGAIDRERIVQMAAGGKNRYGVDGDMSVDQFVGVGGPTPIGRSRITENLAQAGAASAAAGASTARAAKTRTDEKRGRFSLQQMEDEEGAPILARVPVEGAVGRVDIPGVRAKPRRSVDQADTISRFNAQWGVDRIVNEPGRDGIPTLDEFQLLLKSGLPPNTRVLPAQRGGKFTEGAVYRTPSGLMVRRSGGWEPLVNGAAQ